MLGRMCKARGNRRDLRRRARQRNIPLHVDRQQGGLAPIRFYLVAHPLRGIHAGEGDRVG